MTSSKMNFEKCLADGCLLKRENKYGILIVCVYADDTMCIGTRKAIDKFKNELLKPAWNLYLNKLNFKLDNDNELLYKNWFVFYNKNSYQKVHTHGNNLFTMIYFCKVPKTSNENEGQLVITDVKNKSNGIESKYVTPVETKLVIFPAYYPHYTLPIFSDTERVVIVNDIYLRAKY